MTKRVQTYSGQYYPGYIATPMLVLSLIVLVLIRVVGYFEPPFPFDDPAIRNFITLGAGFFACFTLYCWFCFRSDYPRPARYGVLVGCIVLVVGFATTIWALGGLRRTIHFSGSMVPRLAPLEHDFSAAEQQPAAQGIDLASTTQDDFPQFLGPDRTNWLAKPELSRDWKSQPPKQLWKQPIGAGWSGFSAVNGSAVTIEQRKAEEWVTCYDIATGKLRWKHSVPGRHDNPLGGLGPRSTPTIYEGRVYALTATGVLCCLDGATGQLQWKDDLRKRYGVDTEREQFGLKSVDDEVNVMWGRAASPLIVDQAVVVPGGGPAGKAKNLAAFDLESGQLVWESENKTEDATADQIAYASPALATLAGRRQILIVNESTASGHDAATGERLWSHPWPGHSNGNASASQTVPIGDNRVLLTKGYSGGAELLELSSAGADLTAKTVWKNPRVLQTKFTNVVIYHDHAFGLSEGILECVEVASGKRKWKSGRYGHGQILGVGNLLLVLSEEGELNLVELNPAKHVELGVAQAVSGKTWNNLCLYGHKLLVRNAEEAACYELP